MTEPLSKSQITIGTEFLTDTGKWRCTDVGTRTICAIKLEGNPADWIGPPYSVMEHVFNEDDQQVIYPASGCLNETPG